MNFDEIGILIGMAAAVAGAYWLIRRAIRDGIRDAQARPSDGAVKPPTSA